MFRKRATTISTWPAWGLMALMAATRFHHFGDLQTLPDASLAVFFLAGLFVTNPWLFAFLLVEAGLIDYLAINLGGVSGWCVTPAYLFLLPTYGVMWLGGRFSRRFKTGELNGITLALAVSTGMTVLAFLISNTSFYFLSGYFDHLSLTDYFNQVIAYLPRYLTSTIAYTSLILAGNWLWRQTMMTPPATSHK